MPFNRSTALGERFSKIIDVMDIALWELDLEYRVVNFNEKARQIYGDDIIGKRCFEVAGGRSEVCGNCPAKMVYDGRSSGRSEHERTTVSGETIYIDHIATPIYDAYQALTGALVLIIDITKHKEMEMKVRDHHVQLEKVVRERTAELLAANRSLKREINERIKAEKSLKRSERKFRTIFENLQDVFFHTTLDGRIITASPSAYGFSGYTHEELIGNRVDMLYDCPDDRQGLLAALADAGKVREYPMRLKRKNGTRYDVSINADLVFSEDGQPEGLWGTIRDITLQKRLAQKDQRLKKMESLGLMAGGIAHDLNNILSGIVSYPDLLLMDLPGDSPLRRPIETIRDSGERAAGVVRDLLAIARGVATGKTMVNLNTIVNEFLGSGEFIQIQRDYPKIGFKSNLSSALPAISCSSAHMKKTLANLVLNAAESIQGDGTVTLKTAVHKNVPARPDLNGVFVSLCVQDTGQGISQEDMERIFEPFYTKKVLGRNGTGLGLAVVWNTVKDHDGHIDVRSTTDGTEIEVLLPIEDTSVSSAPPDNDTVSLKGNGERILVVDDEATQRQIASDLLTKLGYAVDVAADGQTAVALCAKAPYALLVLDMVMEPGISGRETYERIVQFNPGQKAIIASGYTESDDVKAIQALGAGRFIEKPYTVETIGAAVKEALSAA